MLRSRPEAVAYAHSLLEVPACSEVTRIEVVTGLRSPERPAADALPGTIEGCGHCPQIDAPDRLAELVLDFPPSLAPAS